MSDLQNAAAELRPLIEEWDRQGLEDTPEITRAREVILTAELEASTASMLAPMGVKGLQFADEDGTVSNEIHWDDDGNVI